VEYLTEKLKKASERYHHWIHFVFGSVVWIVSWKWGNHAMSFIVVLIGTYLPDADHLFFIFGYGRKTEYSERIRKCLKDGGVCGFIDYSKKNHKNCTWVISHNLLSLFISSGLTWAFIVSGHFLLGVLFASWSLHYIYDIVEDLLSLGRLNPNWFLRFGGK